MTSPVARGLGSQRELRGLPRKKLSLPPDLLSNSCFHTHVYTRARCSGHWEGDFVMLESERKQKDWTTALVPRNQTGY